MTTGRGGANSIGTFTQQSRCDTFAMTEGGFILRSTSGDTTITARLAAVPEPASLAMAGIGLVVVVGLGLRRRSRS